MTGVPPLVHLNEMAREPHSGSSSQPEGHVVVDDATVCSKLTKILSFYLKSKIRLKASFSYSVQLLVVVVLS